MESPAHWNLPSGISRRRDGKENCYDCSVGASSSDIYEAVLALSRSIAGRDDLGSLLSGVAECLQRIVAFDFAALILHDRESESMRYYVLDAAAPSDVGPTRRLPVEQDPAGWVWVHQATSSHSAAGSPSLAGRSSRSG